MTEAPPSDPGWNWQTTYTTLPEDFFDAAKAAPAPDPRTELFNAPLAGELGLNPAALEGKAGAATFTGQTLPPDTTPIAQALSLIHI